MDWNGKVVLVTGAGGFIGSHLTERLVALGAKTVAFVRYNSNNLAGWLDDSPVKDDVELFFGDICDRDNVATAIDRADVVFHLAALIGIPYSYHAPSSYVRTNVEGTLNVLQAARQADCERIIQTSTSEVYGTARYVPIDEGHVLQGQSPYSASKIGADMMAQAFHVSFDLPVATIRPFNTYGPRQSERAVIPTIIAQALVRDEVQLGSLEPTRDLNFVTDTVEGFIRVAENPAAIGEVINIGNGREISIGGLAEQILALLGKDLPVVSNNERTRPELSEVERLCADTKKAREILAWSPEVSLKEGLLETIKWIEAHIKRYRVDKYIV